MGRYKALDFLRIPTQIGYSDKLVGYLMRIAENKPFFADHLSKPLQITLMRTAKIRAITYSNQIEGNPLDEAEVNQVLETQEQSDNAQREVSNYSDALAFAERLSTDPRPMLKSDFYDLQKLVTDGLVDPKDSGALRTTEVSIANADTGEKIDSCPHPTYLKEAMDDLWQWLDDTRDANPYLRAFAFHFIAVAIHPFIDGNGRTVRLMQHLLLLKDGEDIAKYVPSETAIKRRHYEYYQAIRQSKKLQELTPILEFLAKCFAEAAEDVTEEAKKLLNSQDPATRRKSILQAIKAAGIATKSDLAKQFPEIASRTLERDLEILTKEKKVLSKGEKKGRTYSLR